MSITALLVGPYDDQLAPVNLPDGAREHLQAMYRLIDCTGVDVVRLAPGLHMWLDDMGMYEQPVNTRASMVAAAFGHDQQPYFGPALFTGGDDADGNIVGLSVNSIGLLTRMLNGVMR